MRGTSGVELLLIYIKMGVPCPCKGVPGQKFPVIWDLNVGPISKCLISYANCCTVCLTVTVQWTIMLSLLIRMQWRYYSFLFFYLHRVDVS